MPNWEGSTRRFTLPWNWESEIVPRILRRDHNRCQHIREDTQKKCGRRAADVDHIVSHADGGTDDDSNLQALCTYHHRQKTGREGGIASGKARAAKAAAAKPIHPGLLAETPKPEKPAPF
jgi:5-methylcytosine-specific restriction enzyme A